MIVNRNKPNRWKSDIAKSIDMYNGWFMTFAPKAFRETRIRTTKDVESALRSTTNLIDIKPAVMREYPGILPTLRMSACPPLAVDRLIGLAGVPANLVRCMEQNKLPILMASDSVDEGLAKIAATVEKMVDPDIFVWLGRKPRLPSEVEIHRAATVVADRLCGAVANPIIRNAQEKRQLAAIKAWLEARDYEQIPGGDGTRFDSMPAGTFGFHMNVPVTLPGGGRTINIPIDAVINPKIAARKRNFPIFLEAKSAGDFTNTNKRRKEEAVKMAQLRNNYGSKIRFNLFLCGYFDSGYLGYEAAEDIDWVWEHRIDDLAKFGI